MELAYASETHEYFLDGRKLPSVTTLLKECGIIKTAFYTKKGSDNGSRRHLLTELYDKDILDYSSIAEEDFPFLEAWIKAKAELGIEVKNIEMRVYHPLLGYAGTADRLAEIRGDSDIPPGIYLVDLKCGAKERWHSLQLILYGMAYAEMTGNPEPGLLGVRLGANG